LPEKVPAVVRGVALKAAIAGKGPGVIFTAGDNTNPWNATAPVAFRKLPDLLPLFYNQVGVIFRQ
jgi:hypothetical protein